MKPHQFNDLVLAYITFNDPSTLSFISPSQKVLWRQRAEITLVDAIMQASWGQNGHVFIREYSMFPRSTAYQRALYINNRLRAVVEFPHKGKGCKAVLKTVFTPQEAEQLRTELKERRREDHERYMYRRGLLIDAIRRAGVTRFCSFGDWSYSPGERGGSFSHRGLGGVAAQRALEAAWAGVPHPEEAKWDRALYGARF